MAWQTPKTDWGAADGVRDTDMNRIEENTRVLHSETLREDGITIYVTTGGNDSTGTGTSAAPYRTITKALSSIPRDLGGRSITINVAAGTYAEDVLVKGFTGGTVVFKGSYDAQVTVNSLTIDNCRVDIDTVCFVVGSAGVVITDGAVVTGTGGFIVTGAANSLRVTNLSNVSIQALTSNNSTSKVLSVDNGSIANVSSMNGTGNTDGILAQSGAIVSYSSVSSLGITGTLITTYSGGRVYTGSQPSGTGIQTVSTLTAGQTTLEVTDTAIGEDCMIDVYTDKYGVVPTDESVNGNTLTLTFDAQDVNVNVKVVVN